MICFVLTQLLVLWLELAATVRRSECEKGLETLLLRQQLRILQRTQTWPPRPTRGERLIMAVLSVRLKDLARGATWPWHHSLLLFKPQTVLTWHLSMVGRECATCRRA